MQSLKEQSYQGSSHYKRLGKSKASKSGSQSSASKNGSKSNVSNSKPYSA
ncbi:hypothetical protein [Romboutsia lituseburensis]|nr:hypothetical protein [Romboutsia lituseburensis]MCR8743939.1 hypothetical protein [Romboutsia lituseburensis]